jgi:hypothetical protein
VEVMFSDSQETTSVVGCFCFLLRICGLLFYSRRSYRESGFLSLGNLLSSSAALLSVDLQLLSVHIPVICDSSLPL